MACTADEEVLGALLREALAAVCTQWLASEEEHALAQAALNEQSQLSDSSFRWRLTAAVLVATLQHLLRLPLGLAPEGESRKFTRLAVFWPAAEAFLRQRLSARPALLSVGFLAALKSLAIWVNWQPQLFTCRLLAEEPPASPSEAACGGSASAPSLFLLCIARSPDYSSLLVPLAARLQATHAMTNVWQLRDVATSVGRAVLAAHAGVGEPPYSRVPPAPLEPHHAAGGAAGPRRSTRSCNATASNPALEQSAGAPSTRRRKLATLEYFPLQDEEHAEAEEGLGGGVAATALVQAVQSYRQLSGRSAHQKRACQERWLQPYEDAWRQREADELALATAEGDVQQFMGLEQRSPMLPAVVAMCRADRRTNKWGRTSSLRSGPADRGLQDAYVCAENVIMDAQSSETWRRWMSDTERVPCSAHEYFGQSSSRRRHYRVSGCPQPELLMRQRLFRPLFDALPRPPSPAGSRTLLVRAVVCAELGRGYVTAGRCVMGSALPGPGTFDHVNAALSRGVAPTDSQMEVLLKANAMLVLQEGGEVRVRCPSIEELLMRQSIPLDLFHRSNLPLERKWQMIGDSYNLASEVHMLSVLFRQERALPTLLPNTGITILSLCGGIEMGPLALLLLQESGCLPNGLWIRNIVCHDVDAQRTAVFATYVERHRARWPLVQLHALALPAECVTPSHVAAVVAACGSAPQFILVSPPCQGVTLVCSQRLGFAGERGAEAPHGAAVSRVPKADPLMETRRIIDEFARFPRAGLLQRELPASAVVAPLRTWASDVRLPQELRAAWTDAAEAAARAQAAEEAWRRGLVSSEGAAAVEPPCEPRPSRRSIRGWSARGGRLNPREAPQAAGYALGAA